MNVFRESAAHAVLYIVESITGILLLDPIQFTSNVQGGAAYVY